ncbi:MAG: cupin domain-containing protein [Deltaproteobacteria bacterium]|nr:MAG: cupin domain-containing protein [Deltaproteobacteria bacterium]
MKVIRISEVKAEESKSNLFVGRVLRQQLIDEKMADQLLLSLGTFSPGAKTLWHTHPTEQVLYVVEGKGIVATEDDEVIATPGTILYIPAGENHWHGATPDTSFAHISIVPRSGGAPPYLISHNPGAGGRRGPKVSRVCQINRKGENGMHQKKMNCRLWILFLVMVSLLAGGVDPAQAQEKYPSRAIEIIVPFVPGGSTDLVGRLIADNLKKKWGVPLNVVNKPGGNTVPANLEVHQSKPDGYTVFSDSQSSCSLLEAAVKDLPFKVLDRTFIALSTASPHIFYANAASPIKNLKDVEAEVKKNPGEFTWGSFGGVGAGDFLWRQFFKGIGVDVSKTKPVVTRGGAEIVSFVAGNHIKLGTASPTSGLSHVRAGTVKVVGVSGFRSPDFPDVPTAVEQGFPTVTAVFWTGITGPPKLPSHIVKKWEEAIQEMLKDPEFTSKLKNLGFVPFYKNSNSAQEYVAREMEEAARLWGFK